MVDRANLGNYLSDLKKYVLHGSATKAGCRLYLIIHYNDIIERDDIPKIQESYSFWDQKWLKFSKQSIKKTFSIKKTIKIDYLLKFADHNFYYGKQFISLCTSHYEQ